MLITRSDVLEAIDKENLYVGHWVHRTDCAYCAVGAVLNRQGVPRSAIPTTAGRATKYQCNDDDNLPKALTEKNWLGALSIKWEQLGVKLANDFATIPPLLVPEQLESLKPALKEWVMTSLPEGVIYEGESL